MADNVAITPGSGDSVGADDIAAVKFQRIKIIHGADGVNDGDVSKTNGLPVSQATAPTGTLSNVSSSATSVTIISANTSRKKIILYNDSTSDCYVKYEAGAASTTSFTWYMPAGAHIEEEMYNGEIRAIWIAANGSMRVTEIT